ncbi:uncharacterized protein LOC122197288 isoform X3 [Lactuca sativa]|uniref:uncharacterized protein LOC122197288 isoform X3 n=1 Tax=Lactuca sativa TaxID=4236 RepID=UPI0022AF66F8|nr:uncharacterized protein LOC122197288 isoform X3 [Lactuca sativa]
MALVLKIRNSQYHGLNNAGGSLEHAFIEKLLLWVFYECPKVELDRGFLFASLIQPFVSQFHIYLRMLPPETMVGPFKPQPHLETNISKGAIITCYGKDREEVFCHQLYLYSVLEIAKCFHFILQTRRCLKMLEDWSTSALKEGAHTFLGLQS